MAAAQATTPAWRTRLKPPAALLAAALAFARPAPAVKVSAWAAAARMVAKEASPHPGRWRNDLAPYLTEVMDCLSPSHPATEVTFAKSHQVGATECGINLFGTVVDRDPGPMLIVLPTWEEGKKYNRFKLDPAIKATPALRRKVREQTSRDEKGSTTYFKSFPGGFAQITGANTATGLQMLSVRYLIKEELTMWPAEVEGLGDPDAMADRRTTAFSAIRKIFNNSVPGIKGACRITTKWEASDQRLYEVPCPQCGAFQVLRWEAMRYADAVPHRAHFQCAANGCAIEHHHKQAMVAAGRWVATRPGPGRQPGFWIWQAYSPFVSWDETVADWLAAQGDHGKVKDATRQVLGLAFEEKGEQPDHLQLFARREAYPLGSLPPGFYVVTMAVDVQGNRLEWAVWAWGPPGRALIDRGICPGDTERLATFKQLDAVRARRYRDAWGNSWPVEACAIDAGYNTQTVYAYVRGIGDARVIAVKGGSHDGAQAPYAPKLGTPVKQDVDFEGKRIAGGVMLWPVGTWQLKANLYASLRKTLIGPDGEGQWPTGAARLPDALDEAYCRQLTAEQLVTVERGRVSVRVWRQAKGQPNEALDLACYAEAAAVHIGLDRVGAEGWRAIAARRGAPAEQAQKDLAALWAPPIDTPAAAPMAAAGPAGDAPAAARRAPAASPAPSVRRSLGRVRF